MSPRNNNQEPEAKPDVTVDIPHERHQTPPAPTTAPPLPVIEPLPIRPINITDNIPTPPAAAPVELPVLQHEFHEREGRRWPVILIYTVLAFLVAVAVVFAGRWIYHKTTHQTTKTTKPEAADTSKLPAVPSGSTSANTNPSTTQNTTPASGQLPNNGPGDVVAIFVGTALAVSGLHYIYTLRRVR
jgi:hypothetical protein